MRNIWENKDKKDRIASYEGKDLAAIEKMTGEELRHEIKQLRSSYGELQGRLDELEIRKIPELTTRVVELEMKMIELLSKRLDCVESILFAEAKAGRMMSKEAEALYKRIASK